MIFKKCEKYLINLDHWVVAPDGNQYKAIFGTVNDIIGDEQALGVKTNARSTNWYISIGSMLVAGCEVHFAFKTDKFNKDVAKTSHIHDGKISFLSDDVSRIYDADRLNF